MKDKDHIVFDRDGADGTLKCLGCGAVYSPAMPSPIYMWLAIAEAFISHHGECGDDAAARDK